MTSRWGYPDGMTPEGGWFSPRAKPERKPSSQGRYSIKVSPPGCHNCFIIPNKPQFGEISMKTTIR